MQNRTVTPGAPARRVRLRDLPAALRAYASAYRDLLEASIRSYQECGDPDDCVRARWFDARNDALAVLPAWLLPAVYRTERRIARELGYRNRVSR